jgi:hypothetical protein
MVRERTCWIGVAARLHVLRGVEGGFCMFAHGRHAAVKRLHPGDAFVYYSPTQSLGDKTQPIRRFTAIGIVGDQAPDEIEMRPGTMGWRREARYLTANEADIYPLLPRLSFVTDSAHWGMHFRASLFTVSAADFGTIADAMGVGGAF